tara:strand:- start:432 stop:1001 length:570 start_codon:yes stop_codon:yes gene_type:complete
MKFIFFLISFSLHAASYNVDTGASKITWNATKVLGGHEGTVNFKEGHLKVKDGKIIGGKFVVDMKTIIDLDLDPSGPWNQRLVNHLKSEDFFSVEKHPYAEFVIQKSKKIKGNSFNIQGDLIIKGIKKPLEFKGDIKIGGKNLKGKGSLVFDRTDYDIRFRSGKFFKGLGNKLIHDQVKLKIELVANRP